MAHHFAPDPDGDSPYCALCGLPESNRRAHIIERSPLPPPIGRPQVPEHVLTVHDAPTTSHAAAASIAGPVLGSRRERVLRHVAARSSALGCTTDEVEVALDLTHQTCSSIMNALAAAGLLELIPGPDGDPLRPLTRATRSKRQAQAWRASDAGRQVLGAHVQGVVR